MSNKIPIFGINFVANVNTNKIPTFGIDFENVHTDIDLAFEGAGNWFKGILIVSNFPCFFTFIGFILKIQNRYGYYIKSILSIHSMAVY